jgi:hypothetical protein
MAIGADRLPFELRPGQAGRAAELIAARLRDENGAELIDLLAPLRDARRHGQLTPRQGTGLTWLGAFHAYRALAKELSKRFPEISPMPPSALRLGVEIPVKTSLAARDRFALVAGDRVPIALGSDPAETEPELVGSDLDAAFVPLPAALERQLGAGSSLLEVTAPDLPAVALVIHHGDGARIAGLLAEHFSRTFVSASGEIPYPFVESERVGLVVELVDELRLCGN